MKAANHYIDMILRAKPRTNPTFTETAYIKKYEKDSLAFIYFLGGKAEMTPLERMNTEVEKTNICVANNIPVPKILSVDTSILTVSYQKLQGQTLDKTYESNKITLDKESELFQLLRQMHDAGVVHGDSQLRNFMDCTDMLYAFDLELKYVLQPEKVLDLMNLCADIYVNNGMNISFLDNVNKSYGDFKREKIPDLMKAYFALGYNAPKEFMDFFGK